MIEVGRQATMCTFQAPVLAKANIRAADVKPASAGGRSQNHSLMQGMRA